MLDNREFHYYDMDINDEFRSQEFTGVTHWELLAAKVGKVVSYVYLLIRLIALIKWI
jgi:hypothetical protein